MYELDRIKKHSEQMMRDQVGLQAEQNALDGHMSMLNNQNYTLQKELEGFIEADDHVRARLDRKSHVDTIRNRVDDVLRRSQAEVNYTVATGRDTSIKRTREMNRGSSYDESSSKIHARANK